MKPSPGPRGLRHSTLWNGGAQVAPVASAAIAIPFLSRGLGEERLGLLLLAWTVVSMVSVLDLGVGRALTQMIAVRRSGLHGAELRSVARIGVRISGICGLAAGLLLISLSGWITSALGAEGCIQREASVAVVLVAFSLPFLLVANAFRATL
ncbi:MAG: MATE family efflux transporter, partial [Longimicrobiales bacterium]|nr:MATE family efflux transporter [Longimicrobiales bacterium]